MKKIIICLLAILSVLMICGCSETSADHYQEALKLLEAGERDKAVSALNEAIKADPENAELLIKRAYANMIVDARGLYEIDIEQILADLEKALELEPENEEAMQLIYYAGVMKNEYEEAAEALEELIGNLDVSDETKVLLENAKAGNVKDLFGRTRTQTNYLNGELVYKTYFDCGKDGRISRVHSYDANNDLIGSVDILYDDQGNLLTWVSFTENGDMYRSEYSYGSNGKVTEINNYRMDGSWYDTVNYEYDENGNAVRVIYVYESYTQDHRYEIEDGKVLSDYAYDENGNLIYYYLNSFDDRGNRVRSDSYDENGELTSYMLFSFDEEGNQIGYARYDKDGKLVFETKDN